VAVLVAVNAIVPRVLVIIAVMAAIVITLMVAGFRHDAGRRERDKSQ
jgi:hypothetical protein